MFTNFNNERYYIDFAYGVIRKGQKQAVYRKGILSEAHNNRIVTKCNIVLNGAVIASGETIRNPTDVFCKAVGRKIAMTNALKNISDRKLRSALWTAYFTRNSAPYYLGGKKVKNND